MAAPTHHEEKPSLNERRKSSSGPVIAIVCAVGGVLVVGSLALLMSMSGGDDEQVAAAPAKKPSKSASDTKSGNGLSAEQVNMTRGVKAWRDADKGLSLKGLVSFEIKRVYWLDNPSAAAPDAKMQQAAAEMAEAMTKELGKELEQNPKLPISPDDAKKMQDAARELAKGLPKEAPRAGGPQLCVELSITNVSNAALTMTSWNSRGKTGAWVVDDQLKYVGLATGGGGSLSLAPNQTITDTLQFSTGTKDFSELRLVLPYAALARSGQSGYRLDSAALAGELKSKTETPIAKASAKPQPETAKTDDPPETTIIQAPTPEDDPAVSTNKTPEVDNGEPKEDIRDLIKRDLEKDKKPK